MVKLNFSGHESFICKQFWLKKGYDFVSNGKNSFSEDQAVVKLGVGKNMVRAIRFWLRAFGITNEEDQTQEIGDYLFGSQGRDLYLESIGSIWLMHYFLVKTSKASIYHLVFNEFRRIRPEFKLEQLKSFIGRTCEQTKGIDYNENTINRDIRVLLNNYLPPSVKSRSEIEDSFSGLLFELQLIGQKTKEDILREEQVTYYSIAANHRDSLPFEVVLFAVLDNSTFGKTITFQDLYSSLNSPGNIFALSHEGLYQKIQEICEAYPECSFSETAGNRVLQISSKLKDKFAILDDYYQK
ncbi:MAG: DUF4007 family protein [Saprospiraceae bacterium]|nr:DUF4007 family protein [Saprospiraceae bacterium]